MKSWREAGILLLALGVAATAGCARAGAAGESVKVKPEDSPANSAPDSAGVANLPFSRGRTFAHLNDYLAYLRSLGPQDVPFYAPVRPGVYELVTLRPPGEAPRMFTRAQLLEKFGFKD